MNRISISEPISITCDDGTSYQAEAFWALRVRAENSASRHGAIPGRSDGSTVSRPTK